MKRTAKVLGITAIATTLMGTLSSPVMAQSGRVEGSCSAGRDNWGSVRAYFTSETIHDSFNRINFYLGGPGLGKKSNVTLRIIADKRGPGDTVVWVWNSKDNVRPASGGVTLKPNVPVTRRSKVWVEFYFTFDRGGWDPRCGGSTNKI